jgi:hypothetical protein
MHGQQTYTEEAAGSTPASPTMSLTSFIQGTPARKATSRWHAIDGVITLIFAGLRRMIVIRRELPRSNRVHSGRSRERIAKREDSPYRSHLLAPSRAVACQIHESLFPDDDRPALNLALRRPLGQWPK